MDNNKVIVTGVNGQLGQFFAKFLLEKGLEVVGTVRHKSYSEQPWIFDKKLIKLDLMDLTDSYSIQTLIKKYKPNYFINTAANAFVGESWLFPEQHFQQNTIGVLHQLEAIKNYSKNTRFMTIGTSEELGCTEIGGPQNEDTRISPKSPYGCSKAASRYLVDIYRKSYNLYALQPWCFNFESELRGEKYVTGKICKAVARIAYAIKNNQPFSPLELGNIYSSRSWQFAGDVVDGLWRMLNQEKYNLNVDLYNLSTLKNYCFSETNTYSIKDFVYLAFQEVGINGWWIGEGKDEQYISLEKDFPVLIQINPQFYRPIDVTFLHGDSTAARNDLGWKSTVNFEELVKRMVKYNIQNYEKNKWADS